MPGIHILIEKDKKEKKDLNKKFSTKLKDLEYYPYFKSKVLLEKNGIILGFTGYKSYPFETYKDDHLTVFD